MTAIVTVCPRCHRPLEIPPGFDNVVCRGCSASFLVLRHGATLSLSSRGSAYEEPGEEAEYAVTLERRFAEIEELISEAEAECEMLKSKEQSSPLQAGCTFFGMFMMVILLIALFMFLGRSYIGSWAFYVAILGVALLGLMRIRRKLVTPAQREEMRRDRNLIEDRLTELQAEHHRLRLLSGGPSSDQ